MGANSGIQWTHHTFNPWVGCAKVVSPGCTHCYAEAYDRRVGGGPAKQPRWGVGAPRTRTTPAYWRQPLKWNRAAELAGERHRVFCASLADWLDPEVPREWRVDLLRLVEATPALDWLLLTKRPEYLQDVASPRSWPRNVWLGVTVENQAAANVRIPHLVRQQVPVRFLSCEPLLERVNLGAWIDEDQTGFLTHLDWIIVGGESGGQARHFNPDWARDLVGQARAARAEVAVFVKQMGSAPDGLVLKDHHGGEPAEWPDDLVVREFPEPSERR